MHSITHKSINHAQSMHTGRLFLQCPMAYASQIQVAVHMMSMEPLPPASTSSPARAIQQTTTHTANKPLRTYMTLTPTLPQGCVGVGVGGVACCGWVSTVAVAVW